MTDPAVTVIMATWNRGRHILPSIRSVLDQTRPDFELLVVGDAVEDDTEIHVRSLKDPRVHWYNTSTRAGTQSGPNNFGLERARGAIVAYLGHDDIWARNHLDTVLNTYHTHPEASAVCSGIVLYRQDPHAPYTIEGLFDGASAFGPHVFTPPSAFSHRRSGLNCPRWKLRHETDVSVDYAFEAELGAQGIRFVSTGQITAHKVPANGRHLSYADPDSSQQVDLLAHSRAPGFRHELSKIVATARKTGRYLMRTEESGPIRIDATRSDRVRGISDSVCREVGEGLHLAQDDGPRGLDWRPAQQDEAGWRWSGPNPSPKLQINAVATGPVTLQIDLLALAEHGFPPFEVTLNGTPTPYDLGPVTRMKRFSFSRLSMTTSLKTAGPSILGFRFVTPESPGRMAGVAIGPIRIDPVPPQKMKSSAE
jgi:glycosyltransferase involved in cell wall biosynthesis